MKLIIYTILLLLLIAPQGDHYRLTVTVSGLKPLKGELYISLHNRPQYFQVADSAMMKKKITVDQETELIRFDDVPKGTYAIAIYHDENLNGVMDVNDVGIPREGYGFSTKKNMPGRPKFEQAAFDLGRNDTVEIKMIYHSAPNQNKDDQNK
jgi:uncharacterized protein (DUF2141 family)